MYAALLSSEAVSEMNTPSPLAEVSVIASTLNSLNVVSAVTLYIIESAASARAIVAVTDVQKGKFPFVVSEVPCAIPLAPMANDALAADKPVNCVVGTPKGAPPLLGPNRSTSPLVP